MLPAELAGPADVYQRFREEPEPEAGPVARKVKSTAQVSLLRREEDHIAPRRLERLGGVRMTRSRSYRYGRDESEYLSDGM